MYVCVVLCIINRIVPVRQNMYISRNSCIYKFIVVKLYVQYKHICACVVLCVYDIMCE